MIYRSRNSSGLTSRIEVWSLGLEIYRSRNSSGLTSARGSENYKLGSTGVEIQVVLHRRKKLIITEF